jgi:predicted ATPase
MIRQMSFSNFKVLRQVTTSLERFTVLVGPNASGKSSILQGIHLLSEAARWVRSRSEQPPPYRGIDPADLRSFVSRDTTGHLELEGLGDQGCLRLRVDRSLEDDRDTPDGWMLQGAGPAEMPGWHSFEYRDFIPESALLHLQATSLAKPNYTPDVVPRMGPTGKGLHSALAYLALNQPDAFGELQQTLSRIIPAVRRIRFSRTRVGPKSEDHTAEVLLLDTARATGIPAQLASEGTLLVLGILTALYCPPRLQILLLDDLDRGLHPKAQLDLVSYLRGLLESQPDL